MRDDRPLRSIRGGTWTVIGVGLAVIVLVAACGGRVVSSMPAASSKPKLAPSSEPTATRSPSGVIADSRRVDLVEPVFSDPTAITNPLFPISGRTQVLLLGEEEGRPAGVEVTLLPGTRTIDWNGQRVRTCIVQFAAYRDRRIIEVALDYFAQADDGAVWYFGEDVDNYEGGVIADHKGSWLAGIDGPPGMIMPAHPRVGDRYRPENIPGLVFEEDTVKSIDETVVGPSGPVEGAVLVEEHLMEGTIEGKVFAPGYGEFEVRAEDEVLMLALALPIDASPGPSPAELDTLLTSADDIFDAAPSNRWESISATLGRMRAVWDALERGGLPDLLGAEMTNALGALADAVDAHSPAYARQAAVDVARAALDLQLRQRPVAEIDLARLDLWTRQALADVADRAALAGDLAALETIWSRVGHAVAPADAKRIDRRLGELRAAIEAGDLPSVTTGIARLRDAVVGLESAR